jgi:hypothetical protein
VSHLSIHKVTQESKSAADAKGQEKTPQEIDQDIRLVRLAGLAIELGATVVALHMREHGWAESTAPPREPDLFHVRISAVRTGLVLCSRLHISSNE